MRKIRILVAEDTKEARDLIIEGIKSYTIKKFNDEKFFFIEKAESFSKGLQLIAETDKSKEYFNIFFADIDFTEDKKGGAIDSGFKLIEKAFEICPITKIYTYSAQYKRYQDLRIKNEELVQRGLIVFTMDKSEGEGGEEKWLFDNLDKIYSIVEEENWLWDIWENNQKIVDALKSAQLSKDAFLHLSRFNEINSNLESIILLLQRRKQFNPASILFRLILQLYHKNLEIFITGDKDEATIFKQSEENKTKANEHVIDLLGSEHSFEFKDKKSFLRKLTAYSFSKEYRYGHILNWYRNGSVHPDKKFIPDLANVIFANITLALYVLGEKKNISTPQVESILLEKKFQEENEKGLKDLKNLIAFIKQ